MLQYIQESKLARKVEGYVQHTQKINTLLKDNHHGKSTGVQVTDDVTAPTLQNIASLLVALTNPSKEGQLSYSHLANTRTESGPSISNIAIKYTLLDPTHHFREIVSEARAVILAGGTMSPMSDYTTHLLSYLPESKITTLSCGHVIPKDNLLAWTLSRGPNGKDFEFTFGKRGGMEGEEMLDELGRTVLNICTVIPDGVVVFFPSYAYLDTAVKRWQLAHKESSSLWDKLTSKKPVFMESKDANGGEDVLVGYARAIENSQGGLLLSVVGGKMSEGINFSDGLGRCVVIVGLPFPNIMSGEWQSKLKYIQSTTEERLKIQGLELKRRNELAKTAGREFYENACMRAVNQSIGRAIRHKGDYAAIIMIDRRFGTQRIKDKLPGWIREGLVRGAEEKSFSQLMGGLGAFFRSKKYT